MEIVINSGAWFFGKAASDGNAKKMVNMRVVIFII
jgi:hypothetical protein